MVLSVSGVLLLGGLVFLFLRKDGLKASHAVVCALLGFYLGGTSIAPGIRASTNSIANIISSLHF